MEFDEWLKELRRMAEYDFEWKSGDPVFHDAEAWRQYYNDGCSPREALLRDLEHG